MADTMTCPACKQPHPVGTTWCPVMFCEIPQVRDEPDRLEPPAPDDVAGPPQEHEADLGRGECPTCGANGPIGQPCPQCLDVIPRPGARLRPRQVYIVLPSFRGVAVPRGREIVIGRQSDIPEIREELEAFDAVSRQHCFVTVDAARDIASVRDPNSTNGTWVGDDEVEIGAEELRASPLPTRIRLGQAAYLTITTEGAR